MVEVVAVIAIGAILVSIALRGFGDATSRFATRNARQSLAAMQARTRAYAIERGDLTSLNIDPSQDRAWIESSGGDLVESVEFDDERNVDIRSETAGTITLCMNPRGFGETSCNSFENGTVTLSFVQGGQSSSLTILPLGQLNW